MLSANNLGSFTIVFFKGFGGLFLLPYILLSDRKIDRNTIIGGVIIGITVFIGCALQQIGMELSTVSKAIFITALYIVCVGFINANKILIIIIPKHVSILFCIKSYIR